MSSARMDAEPAISSADNVANFVEVAKKHRARLIALAWRMTSYREEAEDIVQEVLLKAFKALPRFRDASRMDAWLHMIVRNAAFEYLRKRRHIIELPLETVSLGDNEFLPQEISDPDMTPEERLERRELEEILHDAMNEVTLLNRPAIQMCFLGENPYRAIALDLNVSVVTLKSRFFHAKRMLKRAVSGARIGIMTRLRSVPFADRGGV